MVVKEFVHLAFDESNRFNPLHAHDDEEAKADTTKSNPTPNNKALEKTEDKSDGHSMIYWEIGELWSSKGLITTDPVWTHSSLRNICANLSFLSQIEQ